DGALLLHRPLRRPAHALRLDLTPDRPAPPRQLRRPSAAHGRARDAGSAPTARRPLVARAVHAWQPVATFTPTGERSMDDVAVEVDTPGGRLGISGRIAPGYEGVLDAFARNFTEHGEVGAAFALVHDGRTVVDLWGGV